MTTPKQTKDQEPYGQGEWNDLHGKPSPPRYTPSPEGQQYGFGGRKYLRKSKKRKSMKSHRKSRRVKQSMKKHRR